jgi:hypothetical protein
MECSAARRLLEFARPGVAELDAEDLSALEQHLAGCDSCQSSHRTQQRRHERWAAAMSAIPIPSDSQARLLHRLSASRRAWWRSRLLGAAACLIAGTLALTAGYHFLGRPDFDPAVLAFETYERAGQWRSPDEARGIVDRWLRDIDRRLIAPPEWNYRLLAVLQHSDLQGLTSVPTMILTRGDATARIYVVRESAFRNLSAFDQALEQGGCTVAVRRYPEMPGWAFIVVTGGGPVELFLRPNPPRDAA